jgi:hypothetical protein
MENEVDQLLGAGSRRVEHAADGDREVAIGGSSEAGASNGGAASATDDGDVEAAGTAELVPTANGSAASGHGKGEVKGTRVMPFCANDFRVLPDYRACGTRTLQDSGSWLKALRRNNVELVRAPTDHIEPNAVVTQGGERCSADVIAYSAGFHTSRAVWPMQVVGHDDEGLQTLFRGNDRMHCSDIDSARGLERLQALMNC